MDLIETKGKALFERYGLPIARSLPVRIAEEAEHAFMQLGHSVLKVQVPTGHRGKHGGIVEVHDRAGALAAATKLLGSTFEGFTVHELLAEAFVDIAQELYLALTLDRQERELSLLFSGKGGIEIEELAATGGLLRLPLPLNDQTQAQLLVQAPVAVARQLPEVIATLLRLMREQDATLVEVNPLGVTPRGQLMLVDSKVTIDEGALFRHPEWSSQEQKSGTPLEQEARKAGLAYVPLDGDIAVIGNGAGLVMATLDLLVRAGAKPANFLDVGGGADAAAVGAATSLVLRQLGVRGLFVNIFGGITRADEVATGIAGYLQTHPANVPIVVRLTGNHEDEGRTILKGAGIEAVSSMEQAAERLVALSRKQTA